MTTVCVVQARMGSSRLPGKVMMDLDGRPLLRFMLDRLAGLDMDVVVATSDRTTDDPIVECAVDAGVTAVRGPEQDVLGRFGVVLDMCRPDQVVRLTADCPLLDQHIVDSVVQRHHSTGAEYTSNTLIRTHPDGLDVEVVRAEVLREAIASATDPAEREHVTPYIYRRPGRFGLAAWREEDRLGHLRWTVDTREDLTRIRRLATSSQGSWREILASLPPDERQLLDHGFEPANPGEAPFAPGSFDDPADRLVSYRRDGRAVGWVRLRVDDGHVKVNGSIPTSFVKDAQQRLPQFLAQSQQVVDGDLSLIGVGA